jgi:hypothetical protein
MREIVLDTETTGFDPDTGDRIVEIGAVELYEPCADGADVSRIHQPQRAMPQEAFEVHGLGDAFPADKPRFRSRSGRVSRFRRRCQAGDPQRRLRHGSSTPSLAGSTCRFCLGPGDRHAGSWRDSVSRARPHRSMRCAAGSGSTTPPEPCTALCSIPRYWPRSIWN